jgi:hypothetical protein
VAFDAAKRLVPCINAGSATALGGPIGVCYSNVGSLRGCAYAIGGNTDVFAANTLAPGDFVTTNSVSLATPATTGTVALAQVHQWAVPGQLARVEMCTPFRVSGVV